MTQLLKEKTNPILGIVHLFLSISSFISLKNVTSQAKCSIGAFTFSLLYSIVGIVFYTHPNFYTHPKSILRKCLSLKVSYFVQLLLPLLFMVDVLILTNNINFIWVTLSAITASVSLISLWKNEHRWKILNHGFILLIIIFLSFIAIECDDEWYWTVGLILLIALNHFVFIKLPTHYEISRLEISTVGLCFFVVFALNSINEISVSHKTAKKNIFNGQTL